MKRIVFENILETEFRWPKAAKACVTAAFADPAFAPIWSNAQRRQR